MTQALFVYGALRHRPLLDAVAGGTGGAVARPATLPGHRVAREEGGPQAVLAPAEGGAAPGELWTGLSPEALARVAAWEGSADYRPARVTVVAEGGAAEALTYAAPASMPPGPEDWSLDGWMEAQGPREVLVAGEAAAHDPALSAGALARQRPMMGHRAEATLRAREGAPATIRRGAEGGFAWRRARPPAGGFFKFDGLEVDHARFDGGVARGLPREVMAGADAALVLPYDAARDRVLLVEQFRTGPARRGDPRPWTLEPVAGLVDAGEGPEDAARREAGEEAGLALRELVPMFRGYASPGNATDHFFAYLGLCDLPDGHATHGGLASEHEDLRLHVLPAAEAVALVGTGEANAVPLVAMLLWLARWRDGRPAGDAPGRPGRLASGADGA